MNCRDALRMIFEGAAPDEHLAQCPACAAIHESLARLDRALRDQPILEPPAGLAERVAASIVGERRTVARDLWKIAAILAVSVAAAFAAVQFLKPSVPKPNAAAVERGVRRNVDYWISGGLYGR